MSACAADPAAVAKLGADDSALYTLGADSSAATSAAAPAHFPFCSLIRLGDITTTALALRHFLFVFLAPRSA